MSDEIRSRADMLERPPPPSSPPSLPPEGKVTLQVALTVLLGLLVLIALVGAFLGVVEKSALSNILCVAVGTCAGLLTGGSRITR